MTCLIYTVIFIDIVKLCEKQKDAKFNKQFRQMYVLKIYSIFRCAMVHSTLSSQKNSQTFLIYLFGDRLFINYLFVFINESFTTHL